MEGCDKEGESRGGAIRRQQSNWAQEITNTAHNHYVPQPTSSSEDTNSGGTLDDGRIRGPMQPIAETTSTGLEEDPQAQTARGFSNLGAMLANVETQIESIESAMDARRRGSGQDELSGVYGRQVYASLGEMLHEVQETSAEMADRVQTLSQQAELPPQVLDRSSGLVSRVGRACLAHRARCPPEELERRLSRQFSCNDPAAAAAATHATSTVSGTSTAATMLAEPSSSSSSAFADAGVAAAAETETSVPLSTGRRTSSAAGTAIVRQLTLDELVAEADNEVQRLSVRKVGRGGGEREGGYQSQAAGLGTAESGESPRDVNGATEAEARARPGAERDGFDEANYEEGAERFPRGEGSEGAAVGAAAAAADGAVSVYSFGRGDLGALLQPDDSDHTVDEGPVTLKNHWSVLQVSTALFHTVAVTASGDVIGCGQNDEGQVRSDLPAESFLPRPSLLEPLMSHRVTQVSCGLYHTACVTAAGVAITWGGNESGQLGHSPDASHAAQPMAIQVKGAGQAWSSRRRASRVACGDLFTLILTSRAELFSCGVGDCVGGDGTDRKQAELVQSLAGFPTMWMACGNSHAVVIGAGGEAVAFGLNTHGQLGVGPLANGEGPVVLRPRPIVGTFPTPLGGGPSDDDKPTTLTTTSSTWRSPLSPQQQLRQPQNPPAEDTGAGSNEEDKAETGDGDGGGSRSGNAGVAASPPAFRAARAACGQSHTILVSAAGEAWACGRNRSGQLGLDPAIVPEAYSPVHVPLPMGDAAGGGGSGGSSGGGRGRSGSASRLKVVQAAAGRAHTMLLRSNGYVLGFGSDEFGALGVSEGGEKGCIPEVGDGDDDDNALTTAIPDATAREEEAAAKVSRPAATWQPREIPALKGQWVASISAGGEQSFALVVGRTQQASSTSLSSSLSSPSSYGVATSTAGPLLRSGGQVASGTATSETLLASAAASASSVPSASKPGVVGNPATSAGGVGSGGGSFSMGLSGPISRQGSQAMFLRRRFSLPPALKMRTAAEFMELIEQARGAGAGASDGDIIGPVAEATVLEAVRQTFGSPSVLSGCFNVDPPSNGGVESSAPSSSFPDAAAAASLQRVDAEGLEAVYVALLALGPKVVQELWSSIEEGMDVVVSSASDVSSPTLEAGVSFLLKYWQSPTILLTRNSQKISYTAENVSRAMAKICMTVLGLRGPARWQLMRSAKEDYPPALFSSRLVKPMVAHLAGRLKLDGGRGPVYPTAALLLKWLHSINTLEATPKIPYQDFFSDVVSSMPVEELLADVRKWKVASPAERADTFFLCKYAFLVSTETKMALLRAEEEMEQRQAATAGGFRLVRGVGLVMNPFLVLQVNRHNLLTETLPQVAQVPDRDLRKKLKVIFRGEEGVDEGGVAKEFFQLLTVQLFDQSFGMFVPAGEGGRSLWFNKDCVWANDEYGLVGLLVGLAVYAGVILDVPLPLVVFRKVLGQQLSLRDLADVDPELLEGFQKLRDYKGGDEEDVFGIDFRVTWDDLGGKRSHDLKEGGENIPVTAENKGEYVELYAKFLLVDSVRLQFEHFQHGFMRVMGGTSSVTLFRAEELEVLVTGTSELDFAELAKATEYEGGFNANHPTVVAFWDAVFHMDPEEQKRLLMFVTGSMKAPLGGLGKLNFKIQRAGPDTDHLPTAHTCFNLLMLPEYDSVEKLSRLVKLAITECQGFGLR